jgi:hypothetical protein
MLANATLVSFDPTTWTATVRPDGSAATTLTTIPTAANIAPADLIPGRRALIWPGETGEPGDYLLLAVAGPQAGSSPLPAFEGHILARAGQATIFSNSAAEQTLFSYTVPGGLLRTDRALRLTTLLRYLNNTGASRTFTLRIKFGTTTLYDDVSTAWSSTTQDRPIMLRITLANAGASNAQEMAFHLDSPSVTTLTSTTAGLGDLATTPYALFFGGGSSTEDTTADRLFAVTLQASNASTLHTATRRHATLELL